MDTPEYAGKKNKHILRIWLSVIFLAFLSAVIYVNSVNGEFLMDDHVNITDNAFVKNWRYLPEIFTGDMGRGSGSDFTYYRPLRTVAYTAIYGVWGLDARPYHVFNIILHVITAVLVYGMVSLLYGEGPGAFFTAALYAAHPVHAEVVAYISGAGDALSAVFLLLSFTLYVRYVNKPFPIAAAGLPVLYLFALISKENSLVLPALCLLYHFAFGKKFRILPFALIVLSGFAYLFFRMAFAGGADLSMMALPEILSRVPGFFAAITGYIGSLIAPLGLHMGHESRLFALSDPRVVAGAVLAAVLIWAALKTRRKDPVIFFAVSWFFITLLPFSNLYAVAFYMADHCMYLPSVGFFLIAGSALGNAYAKPKLKPLAVSVFIALILFYSCATFRQNQSWRNPTAFFSRVLRYNPASFRALNNLGMQMEKAGKPAKARALYEKALRVYPGHKEALLNLGNIYLAEGDATGAEIFYKKALAADPSYAKAYNNLGNLYAETGRQAAARRMFEKGIESAPYIPEIYRNLGNLMAALGDREAAVSLYGRAVGLDPGFSDAYVGLGNIYWRTGEREKAVSAYRKAIEVNPGDANAYNNLGNAMDASGRSAEALRLYRKAIKANPDFAGAWRNLGMVSGKLGYRAESAEAYKRARELERPGR